MPRTYKAKTMLNKLQYSPTVNPLLNPDEIPLKRRRVWSGSGHDQPLVDPATGEIKAMTQIVSVEEKDDEEFVKVFQDGVKAMYQLTVTGARVFQAMLHVYQNTAMKGGFAEAIELYWFEGKLSGMDVNMSEFTYTRGLRELIDKRFLAPRIGSTFWVNPSLFFKGNRVRFIKEYVRVQSGEARSRRGRPKAIPKPVPDGSVSRSSALEPNVVPHPEPAPVEHMAELAEAA